MAVYFVEIDESNTVTRGTPLNTPMGATEEWGIAKLQDMFPGTTWKQTWYEANGDPAKRYNYAGEGYTFDPTKGTKGAFIPPKPFPSWTLDDACLWEAPVPYPLGTEAHWDEEAQAWIAM